MKDVKKAVALLLKEGAESVKNCVVKNVSIKDMDNYTRVALTLNKEVKQMVANDDGDYVEGTNNVVFVSAYSIGAILSNDENVAFAKNFIMQSPELLSLVLSYAEVDLVLQTVKGDEEYVNPFSDSTEGKVLGHDTILTHVVAIRLGKKGQKIVEKLEDKMLDSMMLGSFGKLAAKDAKSAKDEE